jgi:hypothetical protein
MAVACSVPASSLLPSVPALESALPGLSFSIPPITPPASLLPPISPPVSLPIPGSDVDIPTVVILFDDANFTGTHLLVVTPGDSPISGSDLNSAVVGALDNVTNLGLGALPQLSGALPGIVAAMGPPAEVCVIKVGTTTPCYNHEPEPMDGVADFFDVGYHCVACHLSAEDIMSSIVVLGNEGTTVHFFNAPDFSDREGTFTVTVGPEHIVQIGDLGAGAPAQGTDTSTDPGYTPSSLPAGAVTVPRQPDFAKGLIGHIRTFDNELSSVQFD